jgi:hypothetical protein
MMEVSDVRRRLRGAIEAARRTAGARRERSDAAARDYEQLLAERAIPVFQTLGSALTAEGFRFKVFTPAGSVRLAAEGSNDFVELALDTSADPPAVLLHASRGRGRRQITSERSLVSGPAIANFSDEDVLAAVLDEITPLLER